MNRFFVDPKDISEDAAVLTGEDVKHIDKVLRLAKGDHVMLCDGASGEYEAEIVGIEKTAVRFRLLSAMHSAAEPQCRVTLVQGLPKAGKLETITQKCVELGVAEILPSCMERSVVRVSEKEFAARQERCQRVALEAAKQSRRGVVPVFHALTALKNVDFSAFDLILLAYEEEKQVTLKQALQGRKDCRRVALIIGPEGGISEAEAGYLREKGAVSISLGPRILRTETAGMAALAMLLYELEG